MKRIFVNGTFDLLHRGHLELLNYAKSLGDFLCVGIDTDDRVKEKKGLKRPIYNQEERKFFLEKKFIECSKSIKEDFHPLPLFDGYRKLIDSDLADMKNTGGRFGGAITAALLLKEFIGENDWIHLDIAGPARSDNRKGATGFGVLSLYEFLKNLD